jgi:hypothetical protein
MVTHAHMLDAHRKAVAALTHAETIGLSVPASADVRAQLHHARLDATTDEVLEHCKLLGLALADQPAGPEEITRRIDLPHTR